MRDLEPVLFDLPDLEPRIASSSALRGRKRETWTLNASAEVTIIDPAAVREAAARAEEDGLMVGFRDSPEHDDSARSVADVSPTEGLFDVLAWLLWPTHGQDALLEAGAFRVMSVGSEVVGRTADRCTLGWSITVKLTDVQRLRELALDAHPEDAEMTADSLEVAWTRAADPFAPLQSIPGISWQPLSVDVQHAAAKSGARSS